MKSIELPEHPPFFATSSQNATLKILQIARTADISRLFIHAVNLNSLVRKRPCFRRRTASRRRALVLHRALEALEGLQAARSPRRHRGRHPAAEIRRGETTQEGEDQGHLIPICTAKHTWNIKSVGDHAFVAEQSNCCFSFGQQSDACPR